MEKTLRTQSLKRRQHDLSDPKNQLKILDKLVREDSLLAGFDEKLAQHGGAPFLAAEAVVMQINLGKMCNQTCQHCHVDAGPDRKEIMTQETMRQCLEKVRALGIPTVDLTGGAPEMNPHFRWLVRELHAMGKDIIVRCNLTIIVANPSYHDLPEFYKEHQVTVVSSLPHFSSLRTDAQRGDGVFEASIKALKMLNGVGYGLPDTDHALHLVFNPSGAFLPGAQKDLEQEFKKKLWHRFGIRFNDLLVITNMPISRFLEYLVRSGNLQPYMRQLVSAFNPSVLPHLMCRNTLSVSWDGYLYDCDFNQMLDLKIRHQGRSLHVAALEKKLLAGRAISTRAHCFGCTAGDGSSCGGTLQSA